MSENREQRRKAEREAERRRAEEIERALEAPRPSPFEPPAPGKIVEKPGKHPPKK